MYETAKIERALLVVVKERTEPLAHAYLAEEFRNLVLSSGANVSETAMVKLDKPNPAYYIGKGKVQELQARIAAGNINVVIFNSNLSFSQQRNLEETLQLKTIDRTQLILDIFAKHAHSQEGCLQVELAQLEYLIPRLRGKGILLSRLGGGIGTRGPGETKLEVDRRRISERIQRLKKELTGIKMHHDVMRKKRDRKGAYLCSLVGYTNAGKTSLFNALTASSQTTSSTLFTTLETVTRICHIQGKCEIVLSDTVGFIYKLPPHLIEAFKTTLEELNYADVIIHVVDASSNNILPAKKAVDSILTELGLQEKPTILAFNKTDMLTDSEISQLGKDYPEAFFISALKGNGLGGLRDEIYRLIYNDTLEIVVKVPFCRMEASDFFHRNTEVLKTTYQESEAVFWLRVKRSQLPFIQKQGFLIRKL